MAAKQQWKLAAEGITDRGTAFLARTWRGGPSETFTVRQWKTRREALRQAKAWRADKYARRGAGQSVIVTAGTVEAEVLRWLEAQRAYLKPGTWRIYEACARRQVLHAKLGIGSLMTDQLDVEQIEAWQARLQASGLHPRTISQAKSVLSRALDAAVVAKPQRLALNPCRYVRGLPQEQRQPKVAPAQEDVRAIIAKLPGRARIGAQLALGAGVRYGEAAGVRPEDVDEANLVLHVRRQLHHKGRNVWTLPKGDKVRVVPISASLVKAVREHVRRYGVSTEGTLLAMQNGQPMHDREWCRIWAAARKASGVDMTGVHQLRHAFACFHLAAGESMANIQQWLGHSSLATTTNYYLHAMPNARPTTDLLAMVDDAPAAAPRTTRALRSVG